MSNRKAHIPAAALKQERRITRVSRGRGVWLGLALGILAVGHVKPQITTISQGSQLPSPQVVGSMPDPNDGPRDSDPALQQQQIQAIKIERHAEVLSDAAKLVKLTTRLNTEVEKTHATSLTRKQLRTLAKIQKLAKNVKEMMGTPVQGMAFH